MSLKPRRIQFDEVWGSLRKTVEEVISLSPVNRNAWNNSFKWVRIFFCFLSLSRWFAIFLLRHCYSETTKALIFLRILAMFIRSAWLFPIHWLIDSTQKRKASWRIMSSRSWRNSEFIWWKSTIAKAQRISYFTSTTTLGRTTARV